MYVCVRFKIIIISTLTIKVPAGGGVTAPSKKTGGLFDEDDDDMFSGSTTKVT